MNRSDLKIVGRDAGWLAIAVDEISDCDGAVTFEQVVKRHAITLSPVRLYFRLVRDSSEAEYTLDPFKIASMVMEFAVVAMATLNADERTVELLPRAVNFDVGGNQNRSAALQEFFKHMRFADRTILAADITMHEFPHLKL